MIEKKKKKKGNELYYSARINRRVSTDHSSPPSSHISAIPNVFFFLLQSKESKLPPLKGKISSPRRIPNGGQASHNGFTTPRAQRWQTRVDR